MTIAISSSSAHGAVYRRMARNIAWLVGGKGFAGAASLVYLALAARGLGPERFGMFALILAYGQMIANLTQFQSWQAVIRYGAAHLHRADRPGLARLLGFTASADWAVSVIGVVLVAGGIALFGDLLGWQARERDYAGWFGVALLLSSYATPSGMLRLADRFDLIAYAQCATPLVRLIGSIVVWQLDGGVGAFLIVWALAAMARSAANWIAALTATDFKLGLTPRDIVLAWRENPGIGRFMAATNLASSLNLLWDHLGTLAVGATGGAAAAGGYRIATRLAKALSKPLAILSKVLFPELSRLTASEDHVTLRHIAGRITLVALIGSALIVLVAWFGGEALLATLGGEAYRFAHGLLFILAIAAAIDMAGFTFEPWLNAHGQAGKVLMARLTGTLVYAGLLFFMLDRHGPEGAALSAVIGGIVIRLWLLMAAMKLWRGA